MVLVSGVQQSDSVILFQILFPFRLLQYTEYSSLCYTVGVCWLSIPYQIKMTVFLLSCNSFLSVTPVLTCYCKKFETKMSSNLDFAERIRLSLYQHVGYCVCVCVCARVHMHAYWCAHSQATSCEQSFLSCSCPS